MTPAQRDYVRRETVLSIVINAVLSLVFFFIVFGLHGPVAVSGIGDYAFDFLPQSFAIAFMATLVPGAITARRLRAGTVMPIARPALLPRALLPRAGAIAAAGVLIGLLPAGATAALAGGTVIARLTAIALKMAYGALLALVVTPPGLVAALSSPPGPVR